MNENAPWKPLLAEMIGSFAFFTIGAGAICVNAKTGAVTLVGIALAHGFILSNMINVFGPISGGHFNPAVTVGAWVGKHISTVQAALYILAQLVGGALAGYLLVVIFPDKPGALGTPMVNTELITPGAAVLLEAVFTFFLVLAVYGTGIDHRRPNVPVIGGYGIGLTLMVCILMGGPLTGGSLNPARTFGPALASGNWDLHYVYWLGPMLGAIAAGLLYSRVFETPEETE